MYAVVSKGAEFLVWKDGLTANAASARVSMVDGVRWWPFRWLALYALALGVAMNTGSGLTEKETLLSIAG